jgi:hypothetical protein
VTERKRLKHYTELTVEEANALPHDDARRGLAWRDATDELRKSIYDAAHAKAVEKIEAAAAKRGKKASKSQLEQAKGDARLAVTQAIYRLAEHDGYLNPIHEDPVWGPKGSKGATVVEAKPAKVETGLDLSELPSGYYAVPGGDTRLKVRVAHGRLGTRWEGWTFVSDGAEYGQRKRYGSQAPGSTYKGDIEAELRQIVADPREAQAAYGRLTGTCGACGRPLEDETSVAAGIGPVCAEKWAA